MEKLLLLALAAILVLSAGALHQAGEMVGFVIVLTVAFGIGKRLSTLFGWE